MPYSVDWLVPNKVLMAYMSGEPTPEVIRAFSPAINAAAATGQPPVHVVCDISEVKGTPFNLRELNGMLSNENTEVFGWFIIISGSAIARFLGATIIQLARLRVRVFSDRRAALAFLNEVDVSLPDLRSIES